MTVKEWEECKQLSDKAKQKATQNISREYLHRVWGYPVGASQLVTAIFQWRVDCLSERADFVPGSLSVCAWEADHRISKTICISSLHCVSEKPTTFVV